MSHCIDPHIIRPIDDRHGVMHGNGWHRQTLVLSMGRVVSCMIDQYGRRLFLDDRPVRI